MASIRIDGCALAELMEESGFKVPEHCHTILIEASPEESVELTYKCGIEVEHLKSLLKRMNVTRTYDGEEQVE